MMTGIVTSLEPKPRNSTAGRPDCISLNLWIRQLSPIELPAGVESLEPQNNFWGVDLSDREREAKKQTQALMPLLSSFSK